MPVKKTTKKTAKKAPAKKKKKVAPKKKAAAKTKKGQAYECHVCGLRVVVDNICGCVEEHALICCKKAMKKKRAKK
jgi:hypothetical protein